MLGNGHHCLFMLSLDCDFQSGFFKLMCNSDNDWQTSRKSCNNGLFSICPINSAAYHSQICPIDTKIGTKTVKRNFQRKRYLDQLYILISVWVLQTAIVVQNMPFQYLLCKKTKKQEICWKIQQKMVYNQRSGANTKTLVEGFV